MTKQRQKLTAKLCEHFREPDKYLDAGGPVPGLIFVVGANGNKSWLLRYRFHGKRREMGLGSYPEVSLAAARGKGGEARALLAHDIDPLEHRKQQREQQWLAEAKNMNFLAVAENFIDVKSRGPHPWWCKERAHRLRNILNNKLKSLHELPINSADAAEVITLRLYELLMEPVKHRIHKHKDRVGPRWLVTPTMATTIKHLAYGIGERAHGLKVLPISVANPAGEPLDALLTERQPKPGHWEAVPYNQVSNIYAKLDELSRPAPQDYFSISEAARAIGKTIHAVKLAIRQERLAAYKGPVSQHSVEAIISYEWRIKPADLFALWPMVVDVIPGVRSVVFDLIKLCSLTGPRPSEARLMRWDQYNQTERLVIIHWQETKEGEHIEQEMVIPLSEPANEIVMRMREIQQRYARSSQGDHAWLPHQHPLVGRGPTQAG